MSVRYSNSALLFLLAALDASGGLKSLKTEIKTRTTEGKTPYLVVSITVDPSYPKEQRNILEALLQRRADKDFETLVVTKVKEVKRLDPKEVTAILLIDWVGRRE